MSPASPARLFSILPKNWGSEAGPTARTMPSMTGTQSRQKRTTCHLRSWKNFLRSAAAKLRSGSGAAINEDVDFVSGASSGDFVGTRMPT
jgi:hypothetical protein